MFVSTSDAQDGAGRGIFTLKEEGIVKVTFETSILEVKSQIVSADGAFIFAPEFVYPSYKVHVLKSGYHINLVTFFLPSKNEKFYVAMWYLF